MTKNLIITVLFLPVAVLAGTIVQTFTFAPSEVSFTRVNGFDVPDLRGYVSTSAPGEPIIPEALFTFVVPAHATVTDVKVIAAEQVELPGTYNIHPAQVPRPLSIKEQPALVQPDAGVYGSSQAYPGRLVRFGYTGTKGGYRVCGVEVFPLQYVPVTGKVSLYTSLTLQVSWDENTYRATPLTQAQIDWAADELRSVVVNPADLVKFAPPVRQSDPTDAQYVIITADSYISTLQPLADWHSRKGLTTVFKTVSWITSTYPGYDTQEKIRNFIIDYWTNHGTMWVLLAGAHSVIPARRGRSICSGNTGDIPADLYYMDLQWSWDGNRNRIYGEANGDTVDFYADIYLGRAPIASVANAQTFVNKIFGYEKNPNTSYIKKAYLPWVPLFTGYTGEAVSDSIANITPSGWTDTKAASPAPSTFQSAINTGYGVCHGAAHGDDYGFYTDAGTPIYTTTQAGAQTNGMDKLVIMNSMACISGNFENQSCLSVTLQNNASGGTVANMMNSRYGWGTPPAFGPSEKLCTRFYDFFIQQDSWLIGVAHARGKDVYASLPQTQEVWRWCFYDYNLLGDPAMPVWSDVPGTLTVNAPDSIPTGTSSLRVTVQSSGSPVANARVGVYKSGEVCAQGRTNASGQADIIVSPLTTGWLYVTVSAQDKLPGYDSTRVYAGAPMPYVVFQSHFVDDGGNNQLDPGETVNLYVTLKNMGNAASTNTRGTLREGSTYITLGDSTSNYGTMNAGDTSRGDRYQVTAASGTPPGSQIQFTVHVTSDQGSWDPTFTLTVGVPPIPGQVVMTHDTGYCKLSVIALGSIGYDAPPGLDLGSGFSYPKATASQLYYASFLVGNGTSYVADRYYGNPPSGGPNTDFRIVDSLRPVLPPAAGDEHFRWVMSDASHPSPKGLRVTANSYQTALPGYDDFVALVYDIKNEGSTALTGMYAGVMADFDIGSDPTTNTSAADTVRRTQSMRQASTANPTVGVKILAPRSFANLSAVDHARYVYPDSCMTDGQKWRFLNGTIVQRNSNRNYDWSTCTSIGPFSIQPGESYRCAFAFLGGTSLAEFQAHADSAQSWYDGNVGLLEGEGLTRPRNEVNLVCSPNPFQRAVTISFNLPVPGRVLAQVFDVSGRTVATLANAELPAGRTQAVWSPAKLSSGVYLLKLQLPDGSVTEKLMLLR